MAGSAVVRYGLPFALAVIGYALAGGAGLAIGYLTPWLWQLFRNRHQLGVDSQAISATCDVRPVSSFGARVLVWALLAHSALFMLYSVSIGFWRNSQAVEGWVSAFQPAVSWLSLAIPAFQRMPANLMAKGQIAWVATVQHVLLIGWASLLVFAVWIILEVLVLNGRSFGRMSALVGRRQWAILTLLFGVLFMSFALLVFWGVPYLPEKKPYGVADLMVLAFAFFAAHWLLFVSALSCNALLRWTSQGDAVTEQAAATSALFFDASRQLPFGSFFNRLFSGGSLERMLNHKKKTGEE